MSFERSKENQVKTDASKGTSKRYWIASAILTVVVIIIAGISFRFPIDSIAGGEAERKQAQITVALEEGERLYQGFYYEEALARLRQDPELITEQKDDPIALKIAEIQEARDSLIKYEGPAHHVFFHSLIVYPQLAFDEVGHSAQGYNMWMTTVSEFKKMLPLLYERGYLLYPLEECIEEDPQNVGQVRLKDIYLPPGRIPLILSIDDVNYYDYMKADGFANRLVLGKDGKVWTEVVTPEGEIVCTRDGDVMPILDDFVAENPGFSWRGAKGVMAVTGYEGALGYRITDDLPEEAKWQQEVKAIASAMRANGWTFACHSYTHNSKWFRTGKATLKQVIYDTDRWKQKIEPYIGETNIYISPFGSLWKNNDPRYRYIIEKGGYNLFCPVSNRRKFIVNGDNIVMPRVNLDGYTMNRRPEELKTYYFDVKEVISPERPPLNL